MMIAVELSQRASNQRGNGGVFMTLVFWSNIFNGSFFLFTALALVASGGVFFTARASERAKDIELETYKSSAQVAIAQANEAARQAEARAEEAKKKAAALELQLASTNSKLNDQEAIKPFTDDLIRRATVELRKVQHKHDAIWMAAENDREAQYRAGQLGQAFLHAGFKNALGEGTATISRSANDRGDLVILSYDDSAQTYVDEIQHALSSTAFKVSTRRLPTSTNKDIAGFEKSSVYVLVLKRNRPGF